jgi:hypothetical protein
MYVSTGEYNDCDLIEKTNPKFSMDEKFNSKTPFQKTILIFETVLCSLGFQSLLNVLIHMCALKKCPQKINMGIKENADFFDADSNPSKNFQ